MKTNIETNRARLRKEAARFTQLAKDNALLALIHFDNTDHGKTAREHLVRAESFKAAAALLK